MSRFTDDLVFRRRGEPPPIHFDGILRRHLGVLHAPHAVALDAIREWLASNEPSPTLRRSLEESDFAAALQ
ncbi:hypothetical protein [Nocardioides stalactiti]|uniref:hypothetical protein n=1 Tax=Nocardioides stalactiti TaxID=2755356 RepID=UPI001600DA66|nr:hypothetical protein [Nocardioides stalactiti]